MKGGNEATNGSGITQRAFSPRNYVPILHTFRFAFGDFPYHLPLTTYHFSYRHELSNTIPYRVTRNSDV